MNRQQFEKIYPAELTSIQNEVLTLVLQGKKNKEIANKLNFSESNPAKHIKTIAEKFGLTEYYRDRLIELFIRYKPELVAPVLMEKYGYTNRRRKICASKIPVPRNMSLIGQRLNVSMLGIA